MAFATWSVRSSLARLAGDALKVSITWQPRTTINVACLVEPRLAT